MKEFLVPKIEKKNQDGVIGNPEVSSQKILELNELEKKVKDAISHYEQNAEDAAVQMDRFTDMQSQLRTVEEERNPGWALVARELRKQIDHAQTWGGPGAKKGFESWKQSYFIPQIKQYYSQLKNEHSRDGSTSAEQQEVDKIIKRTMRQLEDYSMYLGDQDEHQMAA